MTNANNKETFESKITFLGKSISKGRYVSEIDLYDLKQLHDSDISKSRLTIICLNSRIEQLLKNLNQKDKEIKELQAEVERLKGVKVL